MEGRLSEPDELALAELEAKLSLVRGRTRSVAHGYTTGLFLHGRSGVGKSHTVLETLKRKRVRYHLTNSHVTACGLFELLAEHPDDVHVFEDVEHFAGNRA